MKTEKELNEDILKITMTIQTKFPELSKYIEEMPFKYSDEGNAEIKLKELKNYYDSLKALLSKYDLNHTT